MSNLVDEINQNNFIVARVGGVCQVHEYVPVYDARDHTKLKYLRCVECGMRTFVPKGDNQ